MSADPAHPTDPADPMDARLARAGIAWRADQPGAPAGPVSRRTSGRGRRWLPAVAAAAVVLVAVVAAGLARTPGDPAAVGEPAAVGAGGGWEPMAASPLSPRLAPAVLAIGSEVVLVLGGDPNDPCGPTASCAPGPLPSLRDGARYDLGTRTWSPVTDAPLPLNVSSSAVLDGVAYLWVLPDPTMKTPLRAPDPAVLAYDPASDAWTRLPDPPFVGAALQLTAAGARLVASNSVVERSDVPDLAYDLATRAWEQLPAAPFTPSFDRTLTWTGEQLVLVAAGPAGGDGFLRSAILDGDAWRTLPPQQLVTGGALSRSWHADRLVVASLFGQGPPTGGPPTGGSLDLASGAWSELPARPEADDAYGLPDVAGERYVTDGRGLVLDTDRDRWLELGPQPEGATQQAGATWVDDRLVVWSGADLGDVRAAGRPLQPGTAETTAAPASQDRRLATGAVWTPARD